jgi:hypothetical protein
MEAREDKLKSILLIVLPLLILALIHNTARAGTGCGSNWLGSDINDPDFWVSKNQNLGNANVGSNSLSNKPRLAPDERPKAYLNPSTVNMSMPAPNPVKPIEPVNNTTSMNFQQIDDSSAELPKAKLPDLNGKWFVKFEGNDERSMDIILIQTNEDIIGSGMLNEEGNKLQILAKGSLENQKIIFDVKTVVGDFVNKIDKRYKLALFLNNNTLSGNYEEYSGEISVNKGNVTVTKLGAN